MWQEGIDALAEGEFLWLKSIFFSTWVIYHHLSKDIQFTEARLVIWILITLENHTISSEVPGYYLYFKDKNTRVS